MIEEKIKEQEFAEQVKKALDAQVLDDYYFIQNEMRATIYDPDGDEFCTIVAQNNKKDSSDKAQKECDRLNHEKLYNSTM